MAHQIIDVVTPYVAVPGAANPEVLAAAREAAGDSALTVVPGLVDTEVTQQVPPAVASAMAGQVLTGAEATVTEGAEWDVAVSIVGGTKPKFDFTVPPGGTAYYLGGLSGTTADLDNLAQTGRYVIGSGTTATNLGLPEAQDGVLDMVKYGTGGYAVQVFTPRTVPTRTWQRIRLLSGTWQPWEQINPQRLRGSNTNGVDLNTLMTPDTLGIWEIYGWSGGPINLPSDFTGRGTLEVIGTSSFAVTQRATARDTNRMWRRTCIDPAATPVAWSDWVEESIPARSDSQNIAVIGDSIAASHNLRESLQSELGTGFYCYQRAWNGETTDGVLMRLGAMQTSWQVEGGIIPASGSVTVTPRNSLTVIDADTFYAGLLAGVAGKIVRAAASGTWMFTRDSAGVAVTATVARFDPAWTAATSGHALVVTMGRNDVSLAAAGVDASVADHVVAAYQRLAEWLTPRYKQFAFLGTLNRTGEPDTHPNYAVVEEINTRLRELFPGHYVDLRSYIVHQAIVDLGLTPTVADTANMATDCPPPSVMADNTHPSDEAMAAFSAHILTPWITGKGWVD